jgi:hypothetical protein
MNIDIFSTCMCMHAHVLEQAARTHVTSKAVMRRGSTLTPSGPFLHAIPYHDDPLLDGMLVRTPYGHEQNYVAVSGLQRWLKSGERTRVLRGPYQCGGDDRE